MRFDHAILVVNDLRQAQADFESLGFTVFYGGQHADGNTENCLIVFQDSAYIELISLVNRAVLDDPNGMHATLFNPGEGWAGFALLSDNLERDVSVMHERGLTLSGPHDNSRYRPDNELVAWRAATLSTDMMPFFLQDRTPRPMRVPDDERTHHANGATGVARIVVAVPEMDPAQTLYQKILGQPATHASYKLEASSTVDFRLGTTILTLAAPESDASPLRIHLGTRSPVIYAMHLYADAGEPDELNVSQLHSGNIVFVDPA